MVWSAHVSMLFRELPYLERPDAAARAGFRTVETWWPGDGLEVIERVGAEQVRLLYDAYHAARAGDDPCRDVAAFAPLIGHVQYADCPGRGAPGTGNVDLAAFVDALRSAGYRGPVGLE